MLLYVSVRVSAKHLKQALKTHMGCERVYRTVLSPYFQFFLPHFTLHSPEVRPHSTPLNNLCAHASPLQDPSCEDLARVPAPVSPQLLTRP